MRHWWRALGRTEQVALVGVVGTLVVGLLGALPAYFVFFQDKNEPTTTLGAFLAPGNETTSTTVGLVAATTTVPQQPEPNGGSVPQRAIGASWSTTAAEYQDHIREIFEFFCPPGGVAQGVWGTDLYTSDSSVCTAAVHAGRTSLRDGGTVTIRIREGAQGYSGSARRGIESSDYGPWEASFEFVS